MVIRVNYYCINTQGPQDNDTEGTLRIVLYHEYLIRSQPELSYSKSRVFLLHLIDTGDKKLVLLSIQQPFLTYPYSMSVSQVFFDDMRPLVIISVLTAGT